MTANGVPKRGRMPWLGPADLDARQSRLYERITSSRNAGGTRKIPLTDAAGRLEGPFNAMLFRPDLGQILQELGAAIRYSGGLPDRTREMAILEIAYLRNSAYEWFAHEGAGRAAGLTDAEMDALRTGAAAPSLTSSEALVREAVGSLVLDRDLPDELYDQVEGVLGPELLFELLTLVGYYDLQALSLQVLRVPLPDGYEGPL
jgi:4-carboxymuconolactone decarboxylase